MTQEFCDMFEEIVNFNQSMSLITPHIVNDVESAQLLKVTTGEIIFKNVTFNYYCNNNLFINKSVRIFYSSKSRLVGFSGSGKATFVNLST